MFCGESIHALVAVLECTLEQDSFAFFHLSLPYVVVVCDVDAFYSHLVEGRLEFFE